MTLGPLRIFVSSPGDVVQERLIARRVIRRLGAQFGDAVALEAVTWEQQPLLATATFQDQLVRPSEADIVVAILWSRLGTVLPSHIRRADGSTYASGTEFEFEDAIQAHRANGKPDILVYRKTAVPVAPSDPDLLEEHLRQQKALQAFHARWFVDDEDGSLRRAFHPFESAADFEELLELHLARLIESHLPPGIRSRRSTTWSQGSPFRGLAPFEAEHAPVFFGRTAAVAQVLGKLRNQVDRRRAFVLIVGPSGGGKSSLVRAGVLPMIVQPGVLGSPCRWMSAVCRPSDGQGDPSAALGRALAQALPGWTDVAGETAASWADRLMRALDDIEAQSKIVLVIDQFEELLTDDRVSAGGRADFVDRLGAWAASGRGAVLATMRSDLYPHITELPALVALKEGDGLHDLLPPDVREIGQIIRLPAMAAGLSFENRPQSAERLDDTIRDAAARSPGALPLLQFLLDELYQRRSKEDVLTYRAYEELGGVEGALARRAEAVIESVSADARESLPKVLRELVALGIDEESRPTRRVAPRAAFVDAPQVELLDALIESRLLVSSLDAANRPVVSLAHEALLEFWPRLKQWREQDRELLLMHVRLATAARQWDEQLRSGDFLLAGGKPLADARALRDSGMRLTPAESDFIDASEQRNRSRRRVRAGAVAALALLTVVAGAAAWRATVESERAITQATTAQKTTEFLGSLFKVADPKENRGDKITVREMLDRGVQQIEGGLTGQRAVRANLLRAMGQAYTGLGLYPRAQGLLVEALAEAERVGEPAEVLNARLALAANRYFDGDFERSGALFQAAYEGASRLYGDRHALVSEALVGLGDNQLELGRAEDAEKSYRRALDIDRGLHGENHADTARSVGALAQLMYFQSRFADAESLFRRSLAIQRALFGDRHTSVAGSLNNLGSLMFETGRYEQAVATWNEALPVYRQVYGEEHHEVATLLNNLGRVELMRGNLVEAARHLDQALAMDRKLLDAEHEDLIPPLNSTAMLHIARGELQQAGPLLEQARQIAEKRKHWMLYQVLGNRADLLQRTGRAAEARQELEQARAALATTHGDPLKPTEAWRRAVLDLVEGSLLQDARQNTDADRVLRQAQSALTARFGAQSLYAQMAAQRLARARP